MKPSILAIAAFGLAIVAALPAVAHHSAAMYDRAHPVTVEGVVENFEWINPHSVLEVTTAPTAALPAGKLTLEMTSPAVLTRAGWTKRTFKPGDHVKVAYAPLRAGGAVGLFVQGVTPTGEVMSYDFKAGEKANIN